MPELFVACGIISKWLTKTYEEFGNTRDYVAMLQDVGFADVEAKSFSQEWQPSGRHVHLKHPEHLSAGHSPPDESSGKGIECNI